MEAVIQEVGKTVRYSVGTWARTVRLAILLTPVELGAFWWLVMR